MERTISSAPCLSETVTGISRVLSSPSTTPTPTRQRTLQTPNTESVDVEDRGAEKDPRGKRVLSTAGGRHRVTGSRGTGVPRYLTGPDEPVGEEREPLFWSDDSRPGERSMSKRPYRGCVHVSRVTGPPTRGRNHGECFGQTGILWSLRQGSVSTERRLLWTGVYIGRPSTGRSERGPPTWELEDGFGIHHETRVPAECHETPVLQVYRAGRGLCTSLRRLTPLKALGHPHVRPQ